MNVRDCIHLGRHGVPYRVRKEELEEESLLTRAFRVADRVSIRPSVEVYHNADARVSQSRAFSFILCVYV